MGLGAACDSDPRQALRPNPIDPNPETDVGATASTTSLVETMGPEPELPIVRARGPE